MKLVLSVLVATKVREVTWENLSPTLLLEKTVSMAALYNLRSSWCVCHKQRQISCSVDAVGSFRACSAHSSSNWPRRFSQASPWPPTPSAFACSWLPHPAATASKEPPGMEVPKGCDAGTSRCSSEGGWTPSS